MYTRFRLYGQKSTDRIVSMLRKKGYQANSSQFPSKFTKAKYVINTNASHEVTVKLLHKLRVGFLFEIIDGERIFPSRRPKKEVNS